MRGRIFPMLAVLSGFVVAVATASASAADAVKVQLEGVIVHGAKALKENISWVVAPVDPTPGLRQTRTEAAPELMLVPGKYRITATLGYSTVVKDIAVNGPGKHVVNFKSGWARLSMITNRGAKPLNENVQWQIYQYTKGGVDQSKRIAELIAPSPQVVLPAGFYTARGSYDGVIADMVMEVGAGLLYKYTINLYAGKATLSAVNAKGKAIKEEVVWDIVRTDKSGKRQTVATHVGTSPTLLLREGNYIVMAKLGEEAGETALEVKSGRTNKLKVKLLPGPEVASTAAQ